MIKNEILKKYNMLSLDEYKAIFDDSVSTERTFYETFLKQTDYIASKLAEGVATKEEYAEELEAREFARAEIRRLEMM